MASEEQRAIEAHQRALSAEEEAHAELNRPGRAYQQTTLFPVVSLDATAPGAAVGSDIHFTPPALARAVALDRQALRRSGVPLGAGLALARAQDEKMKVFIFYDIESALVPEEHVYDHRPNFLVAHICCYKCWNP